jgi:hypothetical protein
VSRKKILQRLLRLLAMAGSPCPAEAETARRLAGELRRRHGVTDAEVESASPRAEHRLVLGAAWGRGAWGWLLAAVASRDAGCGARRRWVGRSRRVELVGPLAIVRAARATMFLASRRMREVLNDSEFGPDGVFKHLAEPFRIGFVSGVEEVLRDRRRRREEAESPRPEDGALAIVEVSREAPGEEAAEEVRRMQRAELREEVLAELEEDDSFLAREMGRRAAHLAYDREKSK